jgi:WD40 repeat protein
MQAFQTQQGRIRRLAFAYDGRTLITASDRSPGVCLWDSMQQRPGKRWTTQGTVTALAASPTAPLLAAADQTGTIWVWNLQDDTVIHRMTNRANSVQCLDFSKDGQWLAAGAMRRGIGLQVLQIRRWEMPSGLERLPLIGHRDLITALSFSNDSKWLASGGHDRSIRLWEMATGKQRFGFNNWIQTFLTRFNVAAGQEQKALVSNRTGIRSLAFSPDDRLLAAATGWSPTIFDVEWPQHPDDSPKLIPRRRYQGHQNLVDCVAFGPNGKVLASACRDGLVKLWDVETDSEISTFTLGVGQAFSVAFAPDGLRAAVGGADGRVVLWDLD